MTVNTTGTVNPINTVGGSNVTCPAVVRDSTAQVALLETIVSEGLFRYAAMLMTVLIPAGTVTLVARAGVEAVEVAANPVDVGAALRELDGPTTVTRTSTVYLAPLLADWMTKTTGKVSPISTDGGSRVIWPGTVEDSIIHVALAETIVSAGLFRYAVKENTVFWLAGIVMAVTIGIAALVDAASVDVAEAELDGATTVTRTSTTYVVPVLGDWTVNSTGTVSPMSKDGGSKTTWLVPVAEIVIQVALLDRTTSEELLRSDVKDMAVF